MVEVQVISVADGKIRFKAPSGQLCHVRYDKPVHKSEKMHVFMKGFIVIPIDQLSSGEHYTLNYMYYLKRLTRVECISMTRNVVTFITSDGSRLLQSYFVQDNLIPYVKEGRMYGVTIFNNVVAELQETRVIARWY